jgi:hypothetical protein
MFALSRKSKKSSRFTIKIKKNLLIRATIDIVNRCEGACSFRSIINAIII